MRYARCMWQLDVCVPTLYENVCMCSAVTKVGPVWRLHVTVRGVVSVSRAPLRSPMGSKMPAGRPPSLGTITPAIGSRSTCGIQFRSTYKSNPSFGFGTASRETVSKRFISDAHKQKEIPGWTPGPGAYKHKVTTGKQPESTTKTEPSYGFGTSERFDKSIQQRQAAVPGPGAYLI